jgi:hypothetical protein
MAALFFVSVPIFADEPATRIKLPKSGAGLLAGASRTPDASAFGDDSRSSLGGPGRTPDASAFVPDPAFDQFVDPLAVGRAWEALDAAALTDGALALMEGERVLLRPHRGLPTKDVVTTAARLAVERRDEASLSRLEKAAATQQRDDLKQLVAAARSAGAASKTAAVPVDIGTVSPAQYRVCSDVNSAALRARLTGNSRYIIPIVTPEGDVIVPGTVPAPVSLPLRQQVVALCGDLPEKPRIDTAALDRLAAGSRYEDGEGPEYNVERQREKQEELRRQRQEDERERREEERRIEEEMRRDPDYLPPQGPSFRQLR